MNNTLCKMGFGEGGIFSFSSLPVLQTLGPLLKQLPTRVGVFTCAVKCRVSPSCSLASACAIVAEDARRSRSSSFLRHGGQKHHSQTVAPARRMYTATDRGGLWNGATLVCLNRSLTLACISAAAWHCGSIWFVCVGWKVAEWSARPTQGRRRPRIRRGLAYAQQYASAANSNELTVLLEYGRVSRFQHR
jgi:hypothetical protein